MGGDKDLHHLDEIVNMCHIIRTLKTATNLTTIRDETKVAFELVITSSVSFKYCNPTINSAGHLKGRKGLSLQGSTHISNQVGSNMHEIIRLQWEMENQHEVIN
jgi:hypothetical protein